MNGSTSMMTFDVGGRRAWSPPGDASCYEQAVALPMPSPVDVLRTRFGLEAFRPWQAEAIAALLGEPGRVLVVAPTGGGKSLTYQLPAAMLEGVTLVISPLVALMEDQVRSLSQRGIEATYLASTVEMDERRARESAMTRGRYRIVYAAPERLASESFVRVLSRCRIALVAIDEAHCIAQWGHDFRPDYLRIGSLLERLRPPRVLACTATATPEVRREIRAQLGFDDVPHHEVLRGFARPNLHLSAVSVDGRREAERRLLESLRAALRDPRSPEGGAIVYAATRKATERFSDFLRGEDFRSGHYHAGMDGDARSRVAERFARRELDVVVATNAFGMGIDRPDIRAVVHVQPPSSIEAYYQEVGRAGRDGAEAMGVLLCSAADIALRRRLVNLGTDGAPAEPALAARAWALFRELLRYVDARTCRHDFVLRYFGDEHELLGGCGHCDVCMELDGADERSATTDASLAEATRVVRIALSAVARAQRRAGLGSVAEMLRGITSERTKKFGFTGLSTFGLLEGRTEAWVLALLRALLAAGWIDLTPSEHPVPFVTRAGAEVMKGALAPRILLPSESRYRAPRGKKAGPIGATSASGSSRPAPPKPDAPDALDAIARELFDKLRAHRASVARERKIAPYIVAHDRTLVGMATQRPRTTADLLAVHGMGPARVEQYGQGFLEVIADAT